MRRLLLVCVSVFLLAWALCAQAPQQERFKVAGSVVNSATNEPVRGAIVYINGRESRTAMAGSDGHFEIEGVPGGSAFVTAQRPGFSPPIQQAQITIGPSSDSLVVKLVPFSKISGRITDRRASRLKVLTSNA